MKTRQYNMDYLRIFACFMVIFLHVAAQNWNVADINTWEWKVFNLYDTAVRSSVPLFLMLSGKLLLSTSKELSIKHFYTKNILKLVIVYFSWAFFYAIDTIGMKKIFISNSFVTIFEKIVNAKFHLWYLPMLVSIYFLVPVFFSLVKYKDGIYVPYACIMFILFGIGGTLTVMLFPESETVKTFLNDFNYALSGYSGYFLLGYTLDKYKDRFHKAKIPYMLAFLILTILATAKKSEIDSISVGEPLSALWGHFTAPTFIETVLIFMIFLKLPEQIENHKIAVIIKKLSKYTLFVYLLHPFILEHLKTWFKITTLSFNPWLSVPFLTLFIFLICMAIAWIADKIPVLNKWLM